MSHPDPQVRLVNTRRVLPLLVVTLVAVLMSCGSRVAVATPSPVTPPVVAAAQTTADRAAAGRTAAEDPSLPPVVNQPYDHCTDTDGKPFATGLPPLPCLPYLGDQVTPTRYADSGGVFDEIVQAASKPKLAFSVPLTIGRVTTAVCVVGRTPLPCPAGSGVVFPPAPFGEQFFGVSAKVYLQSPLGAQVQFGSFAPVRVSFYALGSLPATATVTVRQPLVDGVVQPLRLGWETSYAQPKGTVIPTYERYGPAPYDPSIFFPAPHIRGPIEVEISDVHLDGVALDVGRTCRTSTALDLTAPEGWVDNNSDVPVRGQPGAYRPVTPGKSYLTADVDIPAFTGCVGRGGQDVSPLVTGIVSGPHNQLEVTQDQELRNFGCLPATSDPATCEYSHPPTVDPRSLRPSP